MSISQKEGMFFFLPVFLCLSFKKLFSGKLTEKCVDSKSDTVIKDPGLVEIIFFLKNFGWQFVTQAVSSTVVLPVI